MSNHTYLQNIADGCAHSHTALMVGVRVVLFIWHARIEVGFIFVEDQLSVVGEFDVWS